MNLENPLGLAISNKKTVRPTKVQPVMMIQFPPFIRQYAIPFEGSCERTRIVLGPYPYDGGN